jgi:APA family basic amino acid/polyamine antiporter
VNVRGTTVSARTQAGFTLVPIALFAAFAIALIFRAFALGPVPPRDVPIATPLTAHGLAVSYMAVYFAYSGWINIVYVAGEVADPSRSIPRALIGGTLAVTLLYLLLCGGFYEALGMDGLRNAGEVGTATAAMLAGTAGKLAVTLLIALALTACTNATVLGGARVAYAMARQGALFRGLSTLDGERKVPRRALWVQAALSCLLIISGTFEQLMTMVSLAMVGPARSRSPRYSSSAKSSLNARVRIALPDIRGCQASMSSRRSSRSQSWFHGRYQESRMLGCRYLGS